MLLGSITKHTGTANYSYDVAGFDNSETMKLRFRTSNYKSMYFMANPSASVDEDALWERRLDITASKVNMETFVYSADGKKTKSSVNTDFFCRVGALVRYVKERCNASNRVGATDLALASGEFEYNLTSDYIIRFEMSDDVLAEVQINLGRIVKLKLRTDDIYISLTDDPSAEVEYFLQIKDAVSKGFRCDEDYLGFQLKPKVVGDSRSVNGVYQDLDEIIRNNPEKDFVWLRGRNYQIVKDENLEEICDYIYNYDGKVAYDTETTGLNINFYSRSGKADQCVGVVLTVKEGESFYFPLQMRFIKNLCNGDHWYVMERYLKPILEYKELITHNASFDWKVGYIYNINANIVDDTMAMIALTYGAELIDHPLGLKPNTKIILGRDALELSDLVEDDSWGENETDFSDLPEVLVKLYACSDTDGTIGIANWAEKTDLLGRYNARKVYEIEVLFSLAVGYQEFMGHLVDVNDIKVMREEIQKKLEYYKDEMVKLAGYDFNPNSPKQLLQIMYKELQYPEQISRKTNRPSTGKDELKYLSDITDIDNNLMYPFADLLLKYREHEGVRKIVDKFPEHISDEGFLFSNVMQYGTTTGRVSINKPNYQSYSDEIKKRIIARPGYYTYDTDYSSVESRIIVCLVGNRVLIEKFYDPNFDYHTQQACHMYRIKYARVTPKLRKASKGVNFGLPFGMGDESLGVRIFGKASPENTAKARMLRRAFFKGQEDIEQWFETNRDAGVANGYTETYFGRRRYYHRSQFSVGAIRRQAGNQIIQGTAADIYKTAVGRVFRRICKEGWLGKVLFSGFIHDELFGEVSNEIDKAQFLKMLREEFEVAIDGWCPLYMGFGYGRSWYEAKSIELPIGLQKEIVEKYGEFGFPAEYKNNEVFFETLPEIMREYSIHDTKNRLLAESSQGEEIEPSLNTALISVVKKDITLYSSMDKSLEDSEFEKYHITKLYGDANEVIDTIELPQETQDLISLFCRFHNVQRSLINVLSVVEEDATNSGLDDSVTVYEDEHVVDKSLLVDKRVDTLGLYVDTEENRITLLMCPPLYMDFIKKRVNRESKGYQVRFKDKDAVNPSTGKKGMFYDCEAWLDSGEVNVIQQMYIQYLSQRGAG